MATYKQIEGYKRGEPDIGWWRRQIQAGEKYRRDMANEAVWKTWRSYYRGRWPTHVLPVNMFFKMLRTTVPRIYFRNPSISVQASKPGMEQQLFAQLIERLDNKLIRTMGVKNQMKKMIHNAWLMGTAAGKLGYGAQFTPSPEPLGDTAAPERVTSTFTRKVEWNHLVTENMPWFLSVHTSNFVVPDGLQAFEDTPWVAMRIKRAVDDVKADPRLKNTDTIVGSSSYQWGSNNSWSRSNDAKINEIEMYEIRDMRTGKCILIPCYSTDQYLYYEDDDLQVNNRPNIYPLVFNPDDECFWGIPDSVILEPQQLELNEIRTLQMRHRRISLIKILYKRGAIDEQEVEKLLNGETGIGVMLNKDAEITDVDSFNVGTIPEALFAADQTIQADIRDMLGFSRNQSGEFAGAGKSHGAPTAFEANIVNQASEIRVDERKDSVADLLVSVFEDTNSLVFNQWNSEEVAVVVGPNAIPYWVAFKPAMLKGAKYELQIDPDSTVPETKDMRMQKAKTVYSILKDNPLIDPDQLTRYIVREFHGVQYDNLVRTIQQNATTGAPGTSPMNPMGPDQFMQMMMRGGQPGVTGTPA